MKLYDTQRAPNPRRVRIFLAEKGIEIETVSIDIASGATKSADFLAKNPLGQVPVLELDDGTLLTESIAICRYFELTRPEPPLFGTGALEQAKTEEWLRRVEFELYLPISAAFRHGNPHVKHRFEQIPGVAESARAHARKTLAWFDKELAGRPYLAGDRFTIADISALCAIDFGKVADVRLSADLPALSRWHAEVSKRPSASA